MDPESGLTDSHTVYVDEDGQAWSCTLRLGGTESALSAAGGLKGFLEGVTQDAQAANPGKQVTAIDVVNALKKPGSPFNPVRILRFYSMQTRAHTRTHALQAHAHTLIDATHSQHSLTFYTGQNNAKDVQHAAARPESCWRPVRCVLSYEREYDRQESPAVAGTGEGAVLRKGTRTHNTHTYISMPTYTLTDMHTQRTLSHTPLVPRAHPQGVA